MRAQWTIGVLEALVGFDTTSRNSNLALVEWVEAYLDRFGVPHERVPDATGTKANVWATIGPTVVVARARSIRRTRPTSNLARAQLEACSAFLDRLTAHSCA
jgi:hypothetical protein